MKTAIADAEKRSAAKPIVEGPDSFPVIVPGQARPAPPFCGAGRQFCRETNEFDRETTGPFTAPPSKQVVDLGKCGGLTTILMGL